MPNVPYLNRWRRLNLRNKTMGIFNIPKFDPPQVNAKIFMDLRDRDEVTNNILDFLREQSLNAEMQFKTSRNLIIITIVIDVPPSFRTVKIN